MARPKRILLLGWQHTIGSGLATIPVIGSLREHFGAKTELWLLTRAAPPGASHPFELLVTWVDLRGVFFLPPLRDPVSWTRLVWNVRKLDFDQSVYVDLSCPKPRVIKILTLFSWLAALGRPLGLPTTSVPMVAPKGESARRLANLVADGISVSINPIMPTMVPPAAANVDEWLASRRRPGFGLIAICPGARSPANHWPLRHFAVLGSRLIQWGGYDIVICGGPEERSAGLALVTGWGEGITAAGIFSLSETAHLLARCDLAIGLDTGTSHLAAAVGTPVIVLQGGRCVPGLWDPLGVKISILRNQVPCVGCGVSRCPLIIHPCMRGITPQAVWCEVERVLSSRFHRP
jgi:hypothetical protein